MTDHEAAAKRIAHIARRSQTEYPLGPVGMGDAVERAALVEIQRAVEEERARWRRALDESLNSGDGTYRP